MREGGKFVLEVDSFDGKMERSIYRVREDGRKKYRLSEDRAGAIMDVFVDNALSTEKHYRGMMCDALWAIMPAGKFLDRHLDEGAELFLDGTGEQRGDVMIRIRDEKREIECKLDQNHDWLPREVRVTQNGKTSLDLAITKFAMTDGHWFPAEGYSTLNYTHQGQNHTETRTFVIHDVRINSVVSDERFVLPDLPRGTTINDLTTGKRKILGGAIAWRERFVHDDNKVTDNKGGFEIDARKATRGGLDWKLLWPFAVSLFALGFVVLIKVRRR